MCIRDSRDATCLRTRSTGASDALTTHQTKRIKSGTITKTCLLYTSDAADERSSVDLGGRRIIKKKKNKENTDVGVCRSNAHRISHRSELNKIAQGQEKSAKCIG